jgi:hypothetical protein
MSVRERAMTAVVLGVAALSAMAVGCGGEPEFAPQPGPPDGGVDAAPPPPPVQTVAEPTPTAPAQCDSVQSLAMTTTFQGRAGSEAPGMQPEGAAICGIVPEGQTISGQMFMLQPGFCYTFLAQALPTVTEVDLQVELDLAGGGGVPPALAAFNLKPVLAVDTDTGAQAAVSAKQNCYQWTWPIPAAVKLVAKARTGSGPIAAQAYKKKK